LVFCGKCGLQLSAGDTVCPRCGTPTDPDLVMEESQADNPTIASNTIYARDKTQPNTQGTARPGTAEPQQPLILGPEGSTYAPDAQTAQGATVMGSQPYGMPGQTPGGTAYPGYTQQGAGNYPPQHPSYPGYAAPGASYYQTPSSTYGAPSAEAAKVRARGRLVGLLLILFGLLLILGAMVLFLVTHNSTTSADTPLVGLAALPLLVSRIPRSQ
jgi:zinc-ribbon domain